MNLIKRIITCMCVMLIMVNLSLSKEWRGIVPLHSTRADVERVLGAPTEPHGSVYKTETENISIWYADEPCKKAGSKLWNVPRGTVLSVTVYPKTKTLITDLRLEESKYKRVANEHVEGIVYLTDDEEGTSIETFEGKVNSITYTPAAKDRYLRCPGYSTQQSVAEEREYYVRKFDEYSNIRFKDEKARLDNLAIYLQRGPEMKGYIIVYAGRRASSNEARARAWRAKNYLVGERGINAERIEVIDGGHREELEVELYLLPPSVPAPTATPTVEPSEVQIIRARSVKNRNRRSTRPCR